jgi:prepilin-type N-terminal cleavage/methylation domain-containing protein
MLGGLQTPGQYDGTRTERVHDSLMRLKHPGFTVMEVMIVLAVTGLLFASAVVLISGRQNRTAFDQSIRQIHSQIQQVINEVSIGHYPNLGNVRCNGAGSTVNIMNVAGTQQGANSGCIFMGKALQFDVNAPDPERFNIYSIAGLQKGGIGGRETQSLTEAKPKVIAPSSAESGLPDSTVEENMQNGLSAVKMWYNNGGGNRDIGIVAFTTSFAQYSSSGTILSGSQQVDAVPIDDGNNLSRLDRTKTNGVDVINSRLLSATPNPSNGVFICFKSGGTDQWGLITIGNQGRQLSVNLEIRSTTCA